jgi:hypothetical protein
VSRARGVANGREKKLALVSVAVAGESSPGSGTRYIKRLTLNDVSRLGPGLNLFKIWNLESLSSVAGQEVLAKADGIWYLKYEF